MAKKKFIIKEHPLLVAAGVIGASEIQHINQVIDKKINKGIRWIKKNPKKSAAFVGTGAVLGAVGMKLAGIDTNNNLPYNQGGMFRDPYFQRSESLEAMNTNKFKNDKKGPLKKTADWVQKNPTKAATAGTLAAIAAPHIGQTIAKYAADLTMGYEHTGDGNMINENIRCAIDRIAAGANQEEARELIHQELGARVMDALEEKKAAIASALFTPEHVEREYEEEEDDEAIVEEGIVKRTAKAAGKGSLIGAAGGAALGGLVAGVPGAIMGGRAGAAVGAAAGGAKGLTDDDDDDNK